MFVKIKLKSFTIAIYQKEMISSDVSVRGSLSTENKQSLIISVRDYFFSHHDYCKAQD